MSFPRRAISGLSRVEYRPMKESEWFELKHKKGDKYTYWDFKFPFKHKVEYQEDMYIEKDWPYLRNVLYTESQLTSNYHIKVEDGKIYNMCRVHCVFLDGNDSYEFFPDDNAGLERYNYLCKEFGLRLYDNNEE